MSRKIINKKPIGFNNPDLRCWLISSMQVLMRIINFELIKQEVEENTELLNDIINLQQNTNDKNVNCLIRYILKKIIIIEN